MDLRPDISNFRKLVLMVRRRVRRFDATAGSAHLVSVALGLWLAAAVLDLFVPLPVWLRVVCCGVVAVGVLAVLLLSVLIPLGWPISFAAIIARIEHVIPGMHNRLTTVLDLDDKDELGTEQNADEQDYFKQRLVEQTRRKLEEFDVVRVAPAGPVRRAWVGTAIVMLVVGLALAAWWDRLPTAAARILLPTAEIAPVSRVRLVALPGDAQVLQAEPVTITAQVTRGQVEGLTLRMREVEGAKKGEWTSYPMRAGEMKEEETPAQWFDFTLSQVQQDTEYQIVGGGTWTRVHHIEALRRPMIQAVHAAVRLPDYMRIADLQAVDQVSRRISAPVQSTLYVEAQVQGDAAKGTMILLKPVTQTQEQQAQRERVWFDDELPGGSVEKPDWRWVTTPVYSGKQAHTFNWKREAYEFTTRAQPLRLMAEQGLFVYVMGDATQPVGQLTITALIDAGAAPAREAVFYWGAKEPAPAKGAVHMGVLPGQEGAEQPAGSWVRLVVPQAKLTTEPAKPVVMRGLRFAIDQGRMYVDRAGAVETSTTAHTSTRYEATGEVAMERDAEKGVWRARLPVEADGWWTLKFTSAQGHASSEMEPWAVTATKDLPPLVSVEKPGKSVTLTQATPVPVAARVVDDFGIAAVGVQVGEAADKLGEPRWLEEFTRPQRDRLALTAVDPEAQKLTPGKAMYYRVVARDFQNQIAGSDVFRVELAAPTAATAEAAKTTQLIPTNVLFEGLAKVNEARTRMEELAGKLLLLMPADEKPDADAGKVKVLKNPDGTPMTAGQLREQLTKALEEKPSAEQLELINMIEHGRKDLQDASMQATRQLAEAAQRAEMSPAALPGESELLAGMARQAGRMAESAAPPEGGEQNPQDAAESLAGMVARPMDGSDPGEMQNQLNAMAQARQGFAEAPGQAMERMSGLVARQQGREAAGIVNELKQQLEAQREKLTNFAAQNEQMEKEARKAAAPELDKVSQEQAKLDREAIRAMEKQRTALQQGPQAMTPNGQTGLPAPWQPKPPEAKPPEAKAPETQPPEKPAEKQPADPKPAEMQPPSREELLAHQEQMGQHLESAKEQNEQAQARAQALAEQLRGALGDEGEARAQLPGVLTSPEMAWAAQAHAVLPRPGQSGQQGQPNAAVAAAVKLGSPEDLLRPRPSFGTNGFSLMPLTADPGQIVQIDLSDVTLDAAQRAALYRLPPHMREPLLQGMRERGPEGYQPLIDTYYRRLGQQTP